MVLLVGIGRRIHIKDGEYLFAPRLSAPSHRSVEVIPAGTFVVDDDVAHDRPQPLFHQKADGISTILAQPLVVGGIAFGRGTRINVEAQAAWRKMTVFIEEVPFKSCPTSSVAIEIHIDACAVLLETNIQGVGQRLRLYDNRQLA